MPKDKKKSSKQRNAVEREQAAKDLAGKLTGQSGKAAKLLANRKDQIEAILNKQAGM